MSMTVLTEGRREETPFPWQTISGLTSSAKVTNFDPYPVATVREISFSDIPAWESNSFFILSAVSLKSPPEGHSKEPERPCSLRTIPFDEAEPISIPNTKAIFSRHHSLKHNLKN